MVTYATKVELRESILRKLRNQEEESRQRKSSLILSKFFSLPEVKQSNTILFYASFDGEVMTVDMIKKALELGKEIGLPKVNRLEKILEPRVVSSFEKDLEKGQYGILEPVAGRDNALAAKDIDLVVVPGVAFDKQNHRLGRGAGYYDRFLAKLPSHIPTIGFAFDFQIVDQIPSIEAHDVRVTRVLSN